MPYAVTQRAVGVLACGPQQFSERARGEKCAPTRRKSEETKMRILKIMSIFRKALTRAAAWGALAICANASPLLAQNAIGGNFTLHESARFAGTLLPAGPYKFSIEPIGTVQSIRSIQQGAGHMVLVVVKPERSGPIASMFAMASPSDHAREADSLVLESEKAGTLVQTLYLEKEGLMVDFLWSNPKAKGQVVAQLAVPVQTAAVSRAGGN
jgi:hypothetical protein